MVYLRYAPRRIHCPVHGIVTEAVPWAFPDSHFTKEFDLQVAWLARNVSSSKIKELMRIDWHTEEVALAPEDIIVVHVPNDCVLDFALAFPQEW